MTLYSPRNGRTGNPVKQEPQRNRSSASIASHVLAPALLVIAAILLDPWIGAASPGVTLFANLAPVTLTYLFGLTLFRRAALAALITFVPLALIHYINSVKLEELGQPFSIHDVGLTGQLLADIGLFVRYSHGAILAVVTMLVLLAAVVSFRRERPLGRGPWQLVAAVVCVGGAAWMLSPPAERVYQEAGFYARAWAVDGRIENVGLIAQLVAHTARRVAARPDPDPDRLAEVLERIASGATAPSDPVSEGTAGTGNELPDVLVILSESFFDPSTLAGLEDCEALPRWCELLSHGTTGHMTVPTYGGNTTRTEFEILTGVPYRALARGVYAYNSVVTRPTASIAWTMRHAGYETAAIHPHSRSFWNRDLALPRLGFDRFLGFEDLGPHRKRRGFWVSDTAMTDAIIDTTGSLESPWFMFAISMENHGPWHEKRPGPGTEELERIPVPASLSAPEALALRQFTYHARAAVAELERLMNWMNARQRPTLLLFFGDHLPALDEVFEQAGFDLPEPMNRQPVPWLMLSNRPIEVSESERLPESSYELGLWIAEQSGVPLCATQQALIGLRRNPELDAELSEDHRRALYAELLHRPPDDCERRLAGATKRTPAASR